MDQSLLNVFSHWWNVVNSIAQLGRHLLHLGYLLIPIFFKLFDSPLITRVIVLYHFLQMRLLVKQRLFALKYSHITFLKHVSEQLFCRHVNDPTLSHTVKLSNCVPYLLGHT